MLTLGILFTVLSVAAWIFYSPNAKDTITRFIDPVKETDSRAIDPVKENPRGFTDPVKQAAIDSFTKYIERTNPFTKERIVSDWTVTRWHESREVQGGKELTSSTTSKDYRGSGLGVQVDYRWEDSQGVWNDSHKIFVVRDGRVYDSIEARYFTFPNESDDEYLERIGGPDNSVKAKKPANGMHPAKFLEALGTPK